MSSDTTLRIVQEVFDDLARGDMEAVRGHCHPDVVTSLAGANALSGRYDGIDATFEMLARLELSDGTFAVHPYRFFEDGSGQVVVAMETSATRHGQARRCTKPGSSPSRTTRSGR